MPNHLQWDNYEQWNKYGLNLQMIMMNRPFHNFRRSSGTFFRRHALLTIVALCTVWPAVVLPDDLSNDLLNMDLEQLLQLNVITLNKRPQQQFDLPASIYVITREEIALSGVTRVPDLLLRIPGLFVREPAKNSASISIRNDNQFFNINMLVLIDGKAHYLPTTNNVLWRMLPIAVEDIERIEVIRGNGGTAWGTNSSSGVVNIITRRGGKETEYNVKAGAGNQGYRRIHASASSSNIRLSAQAENDDGFDDNSSRTEYQSVFASMHKDYDKWKLFFSGSLYRERSKNIESLVEDSPQSDDAHNMDFLVQAKRKFNNSDLILKSYYIDNKTDYSLVGSKDIQHKISDFDLVYFTPFFRNQRIQFSSGYRRYQSEYPDGELLQLTPNTADERLLNSTLEYEVDMNTATCFNAGVRYEDYSLINNHYYSYSLRASHKPLSNSMLWASYNHTYQFPSISMTRVSIITGQQGSTVYRQQGNKNLTAERYNDWQLGYRFHSEKALFVDFVMHYVQVKDEIYVDPATAEEQTVGPTTIVTTQFDNHIQSKSWGGELVVNHTLKSRYKSELGITYFRKKIEPQDDRPRPSINEQYAPEWKLTLTNNFKLSNRVDLYLLLNWESSHQYESTSLYQSSGETGERFRVDGNLKTHINKRLTLDMGFKNLFNQQVDWQNDFVSAEPQSVKPSYYAHLSYEFSN